MLRPTWALCAALAAGCADDLPLPPLDVPPEPASATEGPAPVEESASYAVENVAHPGVVLGAVRWRGLRPRLAPLAVRRQGPVCGQEQPQTALAIGPGAGIADAVVTIDVAGGRARTEPANAPIVEQRACRFTPHVVAVTRGRPLVFRNADAVLHNVDARFLDGEPWFEIGLPRAEETHAATPERTGVARVVCNAGHPWESAFVHVVEHPYVAITAPDGAFRIEGVPPGEQTIRVWHEGWDVTGSESGRPVYAEPVVTERGVTVPADGEVVVDFTLGPSTATPPPEQ